MSATPISRARVRWQSRVSAVPIPTDVLGTITATMEWAFYYTPSYTKVSNLVVNGVSVGRERARQMQRPRLPVHPPQQPRSLSARGAGRKNAGMCFTSGSFNITPCFARRRLAVGPRVTVEIIRQNWIGKYYRFTMRARRGPRVQIACLAPGGSVPGARC